MPPFGYIGIDFGTSNSHFSACCRSQQGLRPTPLTAVGDDGCVPTSILWQLPGEREEDILECGHDAQDAWINSTPEERRSRRFSCGFKPDLAQSARARRDAWGFLLKMRSRLAEQLPRPLADGGMHVVIGVPAEASQEQRAATVQVAREAGFGQVECLDEPLGALAYHLSTGELTADEARDGVLVIDFGGGTFDVALASAASGLKQPWGDPQLGGRLFDDLFLQWVLDQNPGRQIPEEEALRVWQNECRELKEKFSRSWAEAGGSPTFELRRGSITCADQRLFLQHASAAEFTQRARNYRPSRIVRRYFSGLDQPPTGLVERTPIDLFQRLEQAILGPYQPAELCKKYRKIVLTGGSCRWPFLRPLIEPLLGISGSDQFLISPHPERTIGEGLALFRLLAQQMEQNKITIEADRQQHEAQFAAAVEARFAQFADELSQDLVDVLLPPVEDECWRWYRQGGSLRAVEDRVEVICGELEASGVLSDRVRERWAVAEADIIALLRDTLQDFLKQNHIDRPIDDLIPADATFASLAQDLDFEFGKAIAAAFGKIAADMAAVVMAIVAGVLAMMKIKMLIVAAIAHPMGAFLFGLSTLVGFLKVKDKTREFVEARIRQHEFNSITMRITRLSLTEARFRKMLVDGRERTMECLRDGVLTQLTEDLENDETGEIQPALARRIGQLFESFVTLAVERLSVLEMAAAAG